MGMMDLAQQLQSQGRGGDTVLAHITPEEAQLLESRGGSGTLNPETGLPEFGFFSDLWDGVKKVWNNTVVPLVRTLAPVIVPAVAIFFPAAIPAIGAWFGATGATAAVVGTAALSAGVTLASGGTLEQAIAGAALGAAASYVTPILGAKANQLLGGTLSPTVQSYLGSALVSGGITAARGGSVRDVFTAAATGAATAYLGTLAKTYYQSINDKMAAGKLNVTQKTADGSLVVAADAETYKKAGLAESQIAAALKSQGVSDAHANLAAKSIVANNTTEQTAIILAEYSGKSGGSVMNASLGKDAIANSVTLGNNSDILLRASDANLMAQDAVQLKGQGLSAAEIQRHLEATGASTAYAKTAAQLATSGSDVAAIASKIQSTAQYNVNNTSSDYSKGQVYNNTDYVVPREVGQVMTAEQQNLADSIPYRDMVTAGTITVDQAATYKDAGYAPADVTKLMSVGYNATDLQDLASVGVNARDLVTLSNTKFAESQINDLMSGGATVTDIATTSRAIDTGKIDVATASQLLSRDISGNAIANLANKGQAQAAANSTLSGKTIDRLASGGFDINKAAALQNSGTNVDQLISENRFAEYQKLLTTPAATATATAPVAPVDPTAGLVNSGTITAQEISDLTANGYTKTDISNLISKGYTAPDLFDLAAAGVPPSTLVSLANTQFPESQINDLMAAGASANDIAAASNIINTGKLNVDNATKLLSKDMTGSQINSLVYNQPQMIETVANSNLSGATISRLTNGGWDLNKAAQIANSGTDVNALISQNKWDDYRMISQAPAGTVPVKDAAGRVSYFEASTGNTLDASGKVITYARAPDVGQGTQTASSEPVRVEVSGLTARVGQEDLQKGPLSEGAVLATQEEIDSGRAVVNQEANAWEVPARPLPGTGYGDDDTSVFPTTPPTDTGAVSPVLPGTGYGDDDTSVFPSIPPTNTGNGDRITEGDPNPNAVITPGTGTNPVAGVDITGPGPVAPPTNTLPPGTGFGDDDTSVFPTTPPTNTLPPTGLPPGTGFGDDDTSVFPTTPPTNTLPPGTGFGDDDTSVFPTTPPTNTLPPGTGFGDDDTSVFPETPPTNTLPPVEIITPVTPYVPVPTPPVGEDPDTTFKGYGPITPLVFGKTGQINNPGLNPGFIQPSPYYRTTSPVQSQYYYGQRPYQPGPTFNQALYNTVPNAPAVPFGLQQMYTPTDLNAYLSQFTAGPVAPR